MQKLGLMPVSGPTPAPGYATTTINGIAFGSDDVRGKLVLLNFWATWCPPCRLEMPSMEKLYQRFKGDGLEIVAVNFMEKEEPIHTFIKESGFTFPVLLDKNGEIAQRYGVHALPITFLIDRQGNLIAKSMGYKDWYAMKTRSFIETLLTDGGAARDPVQAKTMGNLVASNTGRMEWRWLYAGIGVLMLGLAVFLVWVRAVRMRGKINP